MNVDWFEDPTVVEWARHVNDDMVPKLRESACSISLIPGDVGDVKFWVELGASIMLDKPIIAVVMGNQGIPDKLRAVADEVVRCPDGVDVEASEQLRAALQRVLARLP